MISKTKKRTFTLRVDLESYKGIKKGLPNLLNLLKKYNLIASFYIPMGGESNLIDFLKYSGKINSAGERKIKLWSLKEKLRMIFFSRDFVEINKKLLKRILNEGHELGLHGWKHREWTRGLNKININKRIKQSKVKYLKLFGKPPISFASPGFNTNQKVLNFLKRNDIKFISDFPEERNYGKLKNIPITICGANKEPIIEFLVSKGKSDEEILQYLLNKLKSEKIFSFYIHCFFEARFKLELLEKIFKFVKTNKFENKRIIDY